MQTKFNSIRFAICALLLFCGAFATATFSQTLKQITKFDLPGPGGKRFDYLRLMTTIIICYLRTSLPGRPTSSISARTR